MNFKKNILLPILVFVFAINAQEVKKTDYILQISSNPNGADVFLDGEKIGTTPFEKELPPGTKILKFEKEQYKTKWAQLDLTEDKFYKAELSIVTASGILNSEPSGAQIVIDGKIKGETPLLLKNLPIGTYTATFKKEGYVNKQTTWTIKNKRPFSITKKISSNLGDISIISTPAGCRVVIDGLPKGVTPYTEELAEGLYEIQLTKSGYSSYKNRVSITRKQTNTVNALLDELPGSLSVKTNPKNVSFFLNDKQYNNTPTEIKDLKAGKYTLRLERKNFEPTYKEVTIYPGQQSDVNIDLKTITGGIELIVNPPGVSIKVNGKNRGFIEQDPKNPKMSKVFKMGNLPEGTYLIDLFHKRGKPDRKRIKLEVKKGKVTRPMPVEMWISDHILTHIDGNQYEGRLVRETTTSISFEAPKGLIRTYKKSEVSELEKLKNEE